MAVQGEDVINKMILDADGILRPVKAVYSELRKLEAQEKQVAYVNEKLGRSCNDVGGAVSKMSDAMKGAADGLGKMGIAVPMLAGGIAGLAAQALPAAIGLLKDMGTQLVDLVRDGVKYNETVEKQRGRVDLLTDATKSLLSETEAYASIKRFEASQLSLTEEQYGAVAKAATVYARTMGVTVPEAMESLTSAIVSGSSRALRPLGVDIQHVTTLHGKQEEAIRQIVSKYGEMEIALSKLQNRTALTNQVADAEKRLGAEIAKNTLVARIDYALNEGRSIAQIQYLQTQIEGWRLINEYMGRAGKLYRSLWTVPESADAEAKRKQYQQYVDDREMVKASAKKFDQLFQTEYGKGVVGETKSQTDALNELFKEKMKKKGGAGFDTGVEWVPEQTQKFLTDDEILTVLKKDTDATDEFRKAVAALYDQLADVDGISAMRDDMRAMGEEIMAESQAIYDRQDVLKGMSGSMKDFGSEAGKQLLDMSSGMANVIDQAIMGEETLAMVMAKAIKDVLLNLSKWAIAKGAMSIAEGIIETPYSSQKIAGGVALVAAGVAAGGAALGVSAGIKSAGGYDSKKDTKDVTKTSPGYSASYGKVVEDNRPVYISIYVDPSDPSAAQFAQRVLSGKMSTSRSN